jgi:hypothetical protein
VVGPGGRVLATVFAAVTGDADTGRGGFAVPNALVARALVAARARGEAPVGTGQCAG